MVKKDVPIKFKNPNSNMFKVYQAVLHGFKSHQSIVMYTHLPHNCVRAALWNLSFSGMVKCNKQDGRTRYEINDGACDEVIVSSQIWSGISNVFQIGKSHAG